MKTTKPKSLSEARTMLSEAQQQQTWLENKITRYENRIRYVEQRQRRKRTHRLITRGAAVESILPSLSPLKQIQFFYLMDEVFHLPNVAELVQRRLAQFASDEAEGGETESPSTTSMYKAEHDRELTIYHAARRTLKENPGNPAAWRKELEQIETETAELNQQRGELYGDVQMLFQIQNAVNQVLHEEQRAERQPSLHPTYRHNRKDENLE